MDPETVSRAAAGDRDALDALFQRNLGALVAFVRAQSGGVVAARESAVDIAQSVCREVIADLDQFEDRGERAFRNWLFLEATRKIRNRHRFHNQQRRDVSREVAGGVAEDEARDLLQNYATISTPTRQASAKEEMEQIEAAIRQLPAEQRDAVMMSRMMGLDYEDIAIELGKSPSAVRGLVARGLATLTANRPD